MQICWNVIAFIASLFFLVWGLSKDAQDNVNLQTSLVVYCEFSDNVFRTWPTEIQYLQMWYNEQTGNI